MILELRHPAASLCVAALAMAPAVASAQNTSKDLPPVIDVHVHAMDDSGPTAVPMCPNTANFTASDPSSNEGPIGMVRASACSAQASCL